MTDHPTRFEFESLRPYLRLRQVGNTWSIVRVGPYSRYGGEIVASGLTQKEAEQMIKLSQEP